MDEVGFAGVGPEVVRAGEGFEEEDAVGSGVGRGVEELVGGFAGDGEGGIGAVAEGDDAADAHRAELGDGRRLIQLGVGVVFVQLLLGALVRHSEATLACIGMPDCHAGDYFPASWVQRIHMIHRGFGIVVGVTTIALALLVMQRARSWGRLRAVMLAAIATVVAQIVLGIYVVLTFRSVPVAVAHFAGAATLWGLWAYAWFSTGARARAAGAGADPQLLAPVRGVHAVP